MRRFVPAHATPMGRADTSCRWALQVGLVTSVAVPPGLTGTYQRIQNRDDMSQIRTTIARRPFMLDVRSIERAAAKVLPEPLVDHFAVVAGRRYPPKQVISLATGLDRADFTTHQARRVLSRLGFVVGRKSSATAGKGPSTGGGRGPYGGREAERLRPFVGHWVAQRDREVLVAAKDPRAVMAWLEQYDQQADAMFMVPEDEAQARGTGPV